jgi:hypothetical protein
VPRPDGGELTVTAVPAVHGPEDGERDSDGFVNCEVIGFILSGQNLPTIYVSADNASIRTVAEIARRALARAFNDAGLSAQLRLSDHGTWTPLMPRRGWNWRLDRVYFLAFLNPSRGQPDPALTARLASPGSVGGQQQELD